MKKNSSYEGLPDGWKRATFIIKDEHYEFIKELAFMKKQSIKKLMHDMIEKEYNHTKLAHGNT